MGELSKEIWDKICNGVGYDENIHCPQILNTFEDGGSMSDFYVATGASPQRVSQWIRDHPEFFESVQLAKELGKKAWMDEAAENAENKLFNKSLWAMVGKRKFGSADKVSVCIGPTDTPIRQYQQILSQASNGDFTASELKQIMESINIGLRAHEVCELQTEIDELKEGLQKMEERDNEHQVADNPTKKEDKVAVDG